MLQKISAALYRISSIWTVVAAIVVYGFFIARVMPAQSADSAAYAGDWGAPDRHFFYTPDELYTAVATWGDAGRQDYIAFRLGLDIVWALAYTAFLLTITSYALRAAFPIGDRRRLLNLIPLIPLVCDYLENALGITLVSAFPQRLDGLVWLATLTTGAKWSTLAVAHLVMLYALGAAAWARFR
jgi:hypothetical protein